MLKRVRRVALAFHKDESGPNTVEWILLVIIALLVLIAIYAIANWAIGKFNEAKDDVEGQQMQQVGP